jgi:hypothetical protein
MHARDDPHQVDGGIPCGTAFGAVQDRSLYGWAWRIRVFLAWSFLLLISYSCRAPEPL